MITDPATVSVQDLCTEALREAGALGVGQTALAEDITGAWARLQFMLQQWERKRFLVYQLVTYVVTSTGAQSYTVGPGGVFNTGATSIRPDKIERGFVRQLSATNPIDFPLRLLQSMEDYTNIALKQLTSFPASIFYNPTWPLGAVFAWPIPQVTTYALGIVVKQQLPVSFATAATVFVVPYEYYAAMLYNLALRLRPKYQIPSYPGDPLPSLAKDALQVLRGANTAIAELKTPAVTNRPGGYNIFSDRF